VRSKEEYIKGKIEKLKVEWRIQKKSSEEATGGEGSSWQWFERMSEILTGSSKGEGVPGRVDMGSNVLLSDDEEDAVGLEEGGVPKTPMSTASGEHSRSTPTTIASEKIVSPKTASCLKSGVDGKPNSRKRALTGSAAYMAEAITKFAEGSFQVERHKMESQERMHKCRWKPTKPLH
jgi:hypothetical protein